MYNLMKGYTWCSVYSTVAREQYLSSRVFILYCHHHQPRQGIRHFQGFCAVMGVGHSTYAFVDIRFYSVNRNVRIYTLTWDCVSIPQHACAVLFHSRAFYSSVYLDVWVMRQTQHACAVLFKPRTLHTPLVTVSPV